GYSPSFEASSVELYEPIRTNGAVSKTEENIRCRGSSMRLSEHLRALLQWGDLVVGLPSCWPTAGRGLRSHGIGLFRSLQGGIVCIGTICPDTGDQTKPRRSARRSMCKVRYSPRYLRIGNSSSRWSLPMISVEQRRYGRICCMAATSS